MHDASGLRHATTKTNDARWAPRARVTCDAYTKKAQQYFDKHDHHDPNINSTNRMPHSRLRPSTEPSAAVHYIYGDHHHHCCCAWSHIMSSLIQNIHPGPLPHPLPQSTKHGTLDAAEEKQAKRALPAESSTLNPEGVSCLAGTESENRVHDDVVAVSSMSNLSYPRICLYRWYNAWHGRIP